MAHRVTAVAAEVLDAQSGAQAARVSQIVAEVPTIQTGVQRTRVSQIVLEVLWLPGVITGDECRESWTLPTIADFPTPDEGGPLYLYFDEITPDWGEYGQAFPDLFPSFGTLQASGVRRFVFEYDGLSFAEALAMDAHYESTSGALSFTLTHPRTDEVIEGVRYESYERAPHVKKWSQARTVRLVKYTN